MVFLLICFETKAQQGQTYHSLKSHGINSAANWDVQQKLLNAIYSNSTLFYLLPVQYGRKKHRNDAF